MPWVLCKTGTANTSAGLQLPILELCTISRTASADHFVRPLSPIMLYCYIIYKQWCINLNRGRIQPLALSASDYCFVVIIVYFAYTVCLPRQYRQCSARSAEQCTLFCSNFLLENLFGTHGQWASAYHPPSYIYFRLTKREPYTASAYN